MKKAEFRTGVKGFTLVETLLAIVILSSGIIFIMPALFKSGVILAHLSYAYEAELVLDNLFTQKEEDLRIHHQIYQTTSRGSTSLGDKMYEYELEVEPQDSSGHLYLLKGHVQWQDYKSNRISSTTYILQ